jgi:hypothetical protein
MLHSIYYDYWLTRQAQEAKEKENNIKGQKQQRPNMPAVDPQQLEEIVEELADQM